MLSIAHSADWFTVFIKAKSVSWVAVSASSTLIVEDEPSSHLASEEAHIAAQDGVHAEDTIAAVVTGVAHTLLSRRCDHIALTCILCGIALG